jgi:glucose/arabinose dehydrogenase
MDRSLAAARNNLAVCLMLISLIALVPTACRDKKNSVHLVTDPDSLGTSSNPIPQIALASVATGFSSPVHIAHSGDGSGRLFVVEREGRIRIIKNGTVLPVPFLDISSRVASGGQEQGLLSVVFPPGYSSGQPVFYVDYTGTQGVGDTVISRFTTSTDPDAADPASEEQLLTVAQPFTNHNGGQLAFGPDGFLYIGLGDGGGAGDPSNNAQDPGSLLGKILRVDVAPGTEGYAVPGSNPFVNRAGFRPEIWALGLRNPWRFSFDRATGDLYIADVGQNSFEEVDVQEASGGGGQNYGWNIREGLSCFQSAACAQSGLTPPVHVYDHSQGECSITGGFVYRGQEIPALRGVYVYGDFCSGRIWGLRQADGIWENKLLLESKLALSTFGEDEAGNLYVADLSGGSIYKIFVP